ncbi:MAG: phosphoribosylformimino-5-aminoimidazole carboxamide ribotide isomerase [Eubacterium sp.]|nr:phosphoribosylformimino-5-aminoimidazole carboxamide ribotide isomerase [Eubacterium sp.]
MEFRPCIDIHNGKVKQLVGATLAENGARENFVSKQDAAYYARLYQKDGIRGGHVILLDPAGSAHYEADIQQAVKALSAYPGGMQVGGGITPERAPQFLHAGASHVIVTSYVFQDGVIRYDRLKRLAQAVGKERIVLDLSCRKTERGYLVVTDRWRKFTKEAVTYELLEHLSDYADEFLIHAVDVEGKVSGIETELAKMLGGWGKIPVTYAGGVSSFADLDALREYGKGRLHVTIGSALDLFGGSMAYEKVLEYMRRETAQ